MTYTYLITIPLIMTYSFGFTFIKYKEGFIDVGGTSACSSLCRPASSVLTPWASHAKAVPVLGQGVPRRDLPVNDDLLLCVVF